MSETFDQYVERTEDSTAAEAHRTREAWQARGEIVGAAIEAEEAAQKILAALAILSDGVMDCVPLRVQTMERDAIAILNAARELQK